MIKVLIITHDLSLTGAPKSLLYTFEQISYTEKKDIQFDVVSLSKDGGLATEFHNLGAKISYYSPSKKVPDKPNLRNFIKSKFNLKQESNQFDLSQAKDYHVIYANTVVSLKLGVMLKKNHNHIKLILHVHELKTVIKEFAADLTKFDAYIDAYVVPSQMNMDCLVNDFSIPIKKITMIRETSKLSFEDRKLKETETNFFNVMMCGGAYWRKGDDVFIQVANLVVKQNPNIHFYWVGFQSDERKRVNELDICNFKLENNVFFMGETKTPNDWLSKMDLFFLSSREDPFPLAAIEAGMFGLPICCFANATGLTEVLVDKSYIAPYLDIDKMAEIILRASKNPLDNEEIEIQKNIFNSFNPKEIAYQTKNLISSIVK